MSDVVPVPQVQRLQAFVARWLAQKKPKCTGFVLAHVDRITTRLDTHEFAGAPKPKASELAMAVWETVSHHAEEMGVTPQRYALLSVDEQGKALAHHPIRIAGDLDDLVGMPSGAGGAHDEPATPVSAHKQGMRHTEAIGRANAKLLTDLIGAYERRSRADQARLQMLEAQNAELVQKHIGAITDLEKLKSKAHKRELKQAVHLATEARKERLFGMLENFGPIALANLTGASEVATVLKGLPLDKLRPFFDALDEEQADALTKLLTRAKKAEDAEKKLLEEQAHADAFATQSSAN